MRLFAAIEADRPGFDSVLIWDEGERLVAFAYKDGHPVMSRPLDADSVEQALVEVSEGFSLGQVHAMRMPTAGRQISMPDPNAPSRWRR